MLSRNSSPPLIQLSTPSPETSPRASTIFSDCEADDEDTMSEDADTPLQGTFRTHHGALQPVPSYCHRMPTLREILDNAAPPPFTLAAFTAYLHQNHCLENLEFIKDAGRYRRKFDHVAADAAGMPLTPELQDSEELRMLWTRLLHAYIVPNAPREVNLSADVRDALVSLPNHTSPPEPEVLDLAVGRIMELMNESILMNFIHEQSPSKHEGSPEFEERASRQSTDSRTRSPSHRRPSPHSDHTFTLKNPPRTKNSHPTSKTRLTMHVSNSSTGSGDISMTDDTGSMASLSSPMTPPTTPPSSDLGGHSPKLRHDNTWRKMMGRLGTKKKSSTKMDRMEE